ncbi:uncharacterized protein LOC120067635 [Benincasa hispida]|uniref:uncharacterized protein LOC120067635 n=1 Tax=Benincasa hispida TaxID=102211 RepID=UPI0018FF4E98|nr:uncharacterized protein LOC120067635 [Benincasa hispida]
MVHDRVARVVVEFFQGCLGSQPVGYRDLTAQIGDIVQFSWFEEGVEAFGHPVSRDEIQKTLFSIKSKKALGPDGFLVDFYRATWSVVGDDFCEVNSTAITLIPKWQGAERMEKFRPISCCNVVYKCILRILAERLRLWLPAFISELVESYKKSRGKPRCVLKVDLQKAYDSVNWDFLFGVLLAIGMPLQFVSWVRACVTLLKFSVMINGSLEGFFSWFHDRCKRVGLTHLVFVDNLMIFCAAERDSLKFVRQVLADFAGMSGLVANVGKSSMFVAGVESREAEELAAFMGFSIGSLPISYLWKGNAVSRDGARMWDKEVVWRRDCRSSWMVREVGGGL